MNDEGQTPTGSRSAHSAGDRPMLGIAFMALGVSVVPMMDGIAKGLADDYSVLQLVWARFAFHLLWLLPFLLWQGHGRSVLAPRLPGLQMLRGVFLLAATVCYFSAIALMPIADALALLFISPMVVTLLAPVVLGERVGIWRWSAVIAGFIGALIVIRPGFGVFQWASVLALGAGVLHGCYLLTTRRLAGSTNPMITLFYTGAIGLLGISFAMPFVWIPPTPVDWGWMVFMGGLAAGGHFLIIKGFDQAPAPVVAPVAYTEIVAATAIGYFAFGDFPAALTWVGIVVIVTSGIVISVREHRTRHR